MVNCDILQACPDINATREAPNLRIYEWKKSGGGANRTHYEEETSPSNISFHQLYNRG